MQLEIATGFYQSVSLPLAAQRCINWEPIVPQTDALSTRALRDVYGIDTRALTGASITGINRGAQVVSGIPYFINERTLYSFDAANVVTSHGPINGAGRVSLANNGRFLVIVVPGVTAYVFDNDDLSLTEITDNDFQISDTVTFKDGFFVFTASDGGQFFVSNLNQPLVFDALDFGSAEVRPDNIVAGFVSPQNELLIFGDEIIELFQNIGGFGFPFQRVRGGTVTKGLRAIFSLVEFDNTLVFLGGAVGELTAVWQMGGGVRKISTAAIDNAIQEYTADEIADAFSFTYAYGGNYFVAITLTSTRIPSRTLVFDATTSVQTGEMTWHERQSGVVDDRWRVASLVNAYGDLIVADSVDGRIGTFNKDTTNEYGDPIFRQKASSPFQIDQLHIFVSNLKLTMESGVGKIGTGDGSDPQIGMEFSDDGGRSFSTRWMRSYGKVGEFERIPSWRRGGRVPRHRVLRFTTTEDVPSHILRLDAEGEVSEQI